MRFEVFGESQGIAKSCRRSDRCTVHPLLRRRVPADDDNLLRGEDWRILKDVCDEDPMFFELQSSLLDVEREYRGMSRRAGIYGALEDRFRACQFESEQEALAALQAEEKLREEVDRENERSLAIVQKELFGDEEI